MKRIGILWIALGFAVLLSFSGCAEQLMDKNPLEEALATPNFEGTGRMTYGEQVYDLRLYCTATEKEMVLSKEDMPTPIHFSLTEEGLTLQDETLEGILLTGENIPTTCVGVFIWDKISALSAGVREPSEEGITVTLQDVGTVTATEDKIITGFYFPSLEIKIDLEDFGYL